MKGVFIIVLIILVSCNQKEDKKEDLELAEKSNKTNQEAIQIPVKDTIYSDGEFVIIGRKGYQVDVVKTAASSKIVRSKGDTLYSTEEFTVLGDDSSEPLGMYRKFDFKYRFEDYPSLKPFTGHLAKPDFSSNPPAKRFVTRIKDGAKEKPNFASHYRIISWGCGTACLSSVIVDGKTGRIYNAPFSAMGLEFKPDSKLIITNFSCIEENGYYPLNAFCDPETFLWENNKLRKLK